MEQEKYDVFISYSRKDHVDEHKNVIPNNVDLRVEMRPLDFNCPSGIYSIFKVLA